LDEQGKPILDKDGKPLTEEKTVQIPAFKVVSVFDVSQTEGEPLPSIAVNELSGSVQDYQDFFKALEQTSPVPIGFEDIEGGAHGYFHLLDNRIAIQEGMSQLQTIKTAIHEIAHAKLHAIDPNDPEQTNRPDSRTREVQAESVAYAVCQHYGLDTSEYSFGYVAGWSSGRELAELKASLEIIRSAAHELISALDEHLAELRQQREADLSAAQEVAFALDNGNTLFIQTCDSGYDYTLYSPDKKALDGGQLDAPGLTLPDAGQEALNLLGQTATVSEVLLGDKLAAFQEAAEKANELSAPEAEKAAATDLSAEPTVTILWSESDKLQDGETMPLSVANRVFEELDTTQHTEREKDGYTGGWYDKTAFRIDFTLNGQPDNYEGRQDFGDGEGSLVQHIQNYHEYYAKDENWKNFVLHNKGPKAWEQDKAEREMVLTEFIPYLKQHCNLSAMEQTATAALREGQNISPEQAAYYNAVVAYVQDCRPLLNQGQYNLP
ncbi:LPD25 domain-containing protein, partial [Faecalibacterium prausnitzii]